MEGADEGLDCFRVEAHIAGRLETIAGDGQCDIRHAGIQVHEIEVEHSREAAALEEDVVAVEVAVDEHVGKGIVAEAGQFFEVGLPVRVDLLREAGLFLSERVDDGIERGQAAARLGCGT